MTTFVTSDPTHLIFNFDSFFQFGESLGIILKASFLQVTPNKKVEGWKAGYRAGHSTFQTKKSVFLETDYAEVTCSLPVVEVFRRSFRFMR